MKKLLAGTALALCLVGGVAVAQNITKALQQSQDPTGKYGIDAPAQNVYMPSHILSVGSGVGSPTSPTTTGGTCGTGVVLTGTDTMGTIVTFDPVTLVVNSQYTCILQGSFDLMVSGYRGGGGMTHVAHITIGSDSFISGEQDYKDGHRTTTADIDAFADALTTIARRFTP